MPVIAPALRLFAPELWGEVDRFRHFYATTYLFVDRDARAVQGVGAHFEKSYRLIRLAERLHPNLQLDEVHLNERGFTSAENAAELATIIEAAILELYATIDCTAKVLRAIYGAGTRGWKESTRSMFQNVDKLTGSFPGPLKPIISGASWYYELLHLRDELTHLATGWVRGGSPNEPVAYSHRGLKAGGLPLEIEDIFGWLTAMFGAVNAFLGNIFHFLNTTLKYTPVMEPCGMVEGRMLMRQLWPVNPIDFNSGACISWVWFELPDNPTCPFKDQCGAYRNKISSPSV